MGQKLHFHITIIAKQNDIAVRRSSYKTSHSERFILEYVEPLQLEPEKAKDMFARAPPTKSPVFARAPLPQTVWANNIFARAMPYQVVFKIVDATCLN